MWFLWIVGPVAVVLIYFLTASRDKRRAEEADAWAAIQRVKRVAAVPSALAGLSEDIGAGTPVRIFEIIPKVAYVGVFEANAIAGSDHQTVLLQLEEAAPTFTIRPLPVVEGSRITNLGVPFPKHKAFTESFLVEGDNAAAIKRWLTRPLRKALLDLPDVWVRVEGKALAVTLYGATYNPPPADAAEPGGATSVYRAAAPRPRPLTFDSCRLQELVTTADALFAEHGADGAPSLLLDDERDDDDDQGVDQGDEEEDRPFHPPAQPAPSKSAPAASPSKPKSKSPASAPKSAASASKSAASASKSAASKSAASASKSAASKSQKA